jgi:phosphoglycerate kinase
MDALITNKKADKILLCGVVGLIFLKAAGKYRGELGVEGERRLLLKARELMDQDPAKYELPVDVAVKVGGRRREVNVSDIVGSPSILDVGAKTVDAYSRFIKGAGTVFMNGPPGAFELDEFGYGTENLLRAMASSVGTTIVSGGELSAALRKYGIHQEIDHISTAGGALVQYLSGKKLPLVDALERAADKWGPKREVAELWSSIVTLKEEQGTPEL